MSTCSQLHYNSDNMAMNMGYYQLSVRISIAFIILIIPFSFVCSQIQDSYNHHSIIAKVDTLNITAEEYYLSYEYGPAFVRRMPNSKDKHLEYLINEKLLALDGYTNSIDTTRLVRETYKAFIADLSTEEMFKDKILRNIKNTNDEIDTVITEKLIEVNLRWLFTKSDLIIGEYLIKLNSGIPFDSLFITQLKDSILIEDRSLQTTRYLIGRNNPDLAAIIDTLEINSYSAPIHTNDGWYILYMDNFWRNNLISETENTRLKEEAINALTKRKMDVLSDKYVDSLMKSENPTIKNSSFRILRSYLGKHLLDKKLYNEWTLHEILNDALNEVNITDPKKINNIDLVILQQQNISLNDFLEWFWLRDNYIKLNKASLQTFSRSLEMAVWRMVRDQILTREAYSKGYQNRSVVQKQIGWWKDKIIFSAVKNEIANSVMLDYSELNQSLSKETNENIKLDAEYKRKIIHKLNSLKKKYKIEINKETLDHLSVSTENDIKAIDFYAVKKGGLIPRTPYPTIDNDWSN